MAKLTILCVAIVVSVAQCAVLNREDVVQKRVARSPCPTCGGGPDFPPPPPPPGFPPPPPPAFHHHHPPPPPPVFRAENWSGLARSPDGLQNSVFSGAAAAAKQGAENAGEAFSLASSSVGGGAGLSAGQAGHGDATGAFGAKHEISLGGDEHSKGGHGYGFYAGGSYKESSSYHSGDDTHNGRDELQEAGRNTAGFGSGSSAGQSSENFGGRGHQGYGGGSAVNYGKSEGFEGHYNSDAQQVQSGGFGTGSSGSQNGHLNYNGGISSGGSSLGQNTENFGGRGHEGHGGGNSVEFGKSEGFRGHYSLDAQQVQGGGFGTGSSGAQNGHLSGNGGVSSSGSSLGQNSENFGGRGQQGYAGGHSVEFGKSEGFEGHYNLDTQHVEGGGFGTGSSGAQNGHLSNDRGISIGGAGHEEHGYGVSGGNSYGQQGGSYQSDAQQGQQGSSSSSSSSQSGSFGGNTGGSGHSGFEENHGSAGGDFGYQQSSQGLAGNGGESGQLQASGIGSSQGQFGNGGNAELHGSDQSAYQQRSDSGLQAGVSGSANGDAQASLGGALNLASQGLQTGSESGCSTCGKSGYALSNAKSHSGSAVALSISG